MTALTQISICFVEFGRQIDCCSIWRRIVAVWWRFSGSLLEALDKVCYICLSFLYITFFPQWNLFILDLFLDTHIFFSWNLMCISNHYQQVFIFFLNIQQIENQIHILPVSSIPTTHFFLNCMHNYLQLFLGFFYDYLNSTSHLFTLDVISY